MTATTTTSGLIQAGTTKLYHEVRGSGPALLITGGTGDAGEFVDVAPTLAEECTVVTYDRRGMSRSPRPDRWTATSMAEMADDAAALLRALDIAPAVVVANRQRALSRLSNCGRPGQAASPTPHHPK